MKALLAQLAPAEDVDANVDRVVEAITGRPEADIAIFPELFLTGYRPLEAADRCLLTDGAELARVAAACGDAGTSAVVGFAEQGGIDGQEAANAIACFDRSGRLEAVYRKVQLFGEDEMASFRPGDELCLARLSGVAVAPLICFDVEFPEPARAMALAGAQLLVTASANMDPYYPDHEIASRARALENRLPHLYVNRVGSESGRRFVGGSRSIDRDGAVIDELGPDEELLLTEVDLQRPEPESEVDYLNLIRTGLRVTKSKHLQGES